MSQRPAALARLDRRKGAITPGADADLIIWDPEAWFRVDARRLQQRHKLTPYDQRHLRGTVLTSYLRGSRVWHDGRLELAGQGRLL
jgi:allantoinase